MCAHEVVKVCYHVSVISCTLYLSPVRSLTKLESVDWRHGDTPTLISKTGTNGGHGGRWSERAREREEKWMMTRGV